MTFKNIEPKTITITIGYRSNKYQLQFSDDMTLDGLMKELHRIPILLDYTPQTMADWQGEFEYMNNSWMGDTTNDRLLHELDLEVQVEGLENKLARITAENIFDILAPGAREDSAVTINRKRLQDALDALGGNL